ncbi:iron complex transport system substrate-binding protein [Candidatus Kryptobacter tengchongensis]|uniref:Iron complex transport system substrate-binding protein n=1 Tax=Kryptobacter tengchongensis TaxID=1643429 RepID=A0A916PEK5_KRYT1|nr:cobalamin-binding protein [Candidatus Kryptobacter tengchongensis]CUT01068.1 iron complex transport system substrate-binding protein [Candidatus Kryptobacter tengchongensis]CUU08721.1 iron complex transport system substrate-binding protein [Candidatus Kryptobacter tengchongensis]CUU10407.1 iron complex transport system substrate-binding protein [Candidatus Kryptobacter tengchongensis]
MRNFFRLIFLILYIGNQLFTQIKVYDDLGRKIEFESPPQRIVSLAPSITEILFFLGLGDRVVGVTRYCNFPPEAQRKRVIGGVIDPNYEIIASLKPDLIIMTVEGNTREAFDKLSELGFKIFVTNPRNFDGILKTILDFGKICGVEARANYLVDSLKLELEKIKDVNTGKKKPKILVLISLNPLMSAGKNTFINEIIERAGGVNVAGKLKQNYPIFSREEILKVNPDMIILTESEIEKEELLKQFPEWRYINAVKENRIFKIEPDIILRPSPRVILATKVIAQMINKFSK